MTEINELLSILSSVADTFKPATLSLFEIIFCK
jgi:hypothetical protein